MSEESGCCNNESFGITNPYFIEKTIVQVELLVDGYVHPEQQHCFAVLRSLFLKCDIDLDTN